MKFVVLCTVYYSFFPIGVPDQTLCNICFYWTKKTSSESVPNVPSLSVTSSRSKICLRLSVFSSMLDARPSNDGCNSLSGAMVRTLSALACVSWLYYSCQVLCRRHNALCLIIYYNFNVFCFWMRLFHHTGFQEVFWRNIRAGGVSFRNYPYRLCDLRSLHRAVFARVKWPGREAVRWHPSRVQVKNEWACNSTPAHLVMSRFIFTLRTNIVHTLNALYHNVSCSNSAMLWSKEKYSCC